MTDTPPGDSSPTLVVEIFDRIASIRLNRPARRNTLSLETLDQLDDALSVRISRADVSAIIFTGTGDVFASGADIRELAALNPATARDFAARGQRLFQRIADAPLLTVAAVNGFCIGGGLDLALACRYRCASPCAVLAHPGVNLGIITGWGGTQRLPRLIGASRALEMLMTARRLTSSEAHEGGLIDRIDSDVLRCARELMKTLIDSPGA